MRWFVIRLGDGVLDPFVVAEAVDENWAREETRLMKNKAVLSEEELALDPQLSHVLDAWSSHDDSVHGTWEADLEADVIVDDADMALRTATDPAERPTEESGREEREHFLRDQLEELDGLDGLGPARNQFVPLDVEVDPEVLRYYWATGDLNLKLWAIEHRFGIEEAAAISGLIARDLANVDHGRKVL